MAEDDPNFVVDLIKAGYRQYASDDPNEEPDLPLSDRDAATLQALGRDQAQADAHGCRQAVSQGARGGDR